MGGSRIDDAGFWDDYAGGAMSIPPFLMSFAERAVAEADLRRGARVLDIATGTGAVAVAAARAGMSVVASDFSEAMVALVESYMIVNVDARRYDGTALDVADASFDAAFSNFGVSLFAQWRSGLSEMARVVKPGGVGSVGAWQAAGGASATLLLAELCAELFPDVQHPPQPEGQAVMRNPESLTVALTDAGFVDVTIVVESNDALVTDEDLADPDRLFTFSPLWPLLDDTQRDMVVAEIRTRGLPFAVPSPALIATAIRA